MDVVHAWASGAPFSQLCKMTVAFEGSIIRCIRRLEELMRQMCQASKAIGNTDLEKKFEEGEPILKSSTVTFDLSSISLSGLQKVFAVGPALV